MNYIDLFHGIGGFALGAYWAGMKFENHFCSDIEPYAQKLYKLRFPDSVQLGDITKIDTEALKQYGTEWIITGGFPCQDISIAGKGAGITGERSGLWFEYWRIIRDLRPRFAIMENVGALTFRGLDAVLGSLSEIGYNAEWQDIRASDMGAPHKRERIWIVAYTEQMRQQHGEHEERPRCEEGLFARGCQDVADTGNTGKERRRQDSGVGLLKADEGEIDCRAWQGVNQWSTEPDVGRLAHGLPGRVDRLKGLGNAIVPQIAELLFNQIKVLVTSEPRMAS